MVFLVSVGLGSATGFLIAAGSLRMILAAAAAVLIGLGLLYPRLIMLVLVALVACLSESTYGVEATQSVFRLSGYRLAPTGLNIYEILVYCLLVVLLARRAIVARPREVPLWITVPCLLTAAVFLVQSTRALLSGSPYAEVMQPGAGSYALALVAALWCFCELLGDSAKRLQLLDLLYVCATGRAAYALIRFASGSGDPQNAYRASGVKVAIWDSADHLLFAFLIAVAIGAWATERVDRNRLAFWMSGSVLMALTTILSFRRSDWFGLVAALTLTVFVLLRRRQRSMALVPGLIAVVAAIAAWSYTRFRSASGGVIERIFPDLVTASGPTRQEEWAQAWRTIMESPLVGSMTARRAAGRAQFWSTEVVHNAFLFAWMKFGLAGLLSLVTLAVSCIVYAVRGVKARGPEAHIALGMLSIVPFGLVLCMFESALISLRTMLVLAVAGALAVRVATPSNGVHSETWSPKGASGASGSGLGLPDSGAPRRTEHP